MGNPIPTSIEIGGTLKPNKLKQLYAKEALIDEFFDAVCEDCVHPEWGSYWSKDHADDKKKFIAYLQKAIKDKKTIDLRNDQANYGQLDYVIAFCQNHDLPFIKQTDPDCDEPETVTYWEPDGELKERIASSGAVVIPISEIETVIDSKLTEQEKLEKLKEMVEDRKPPELPPFNFEGDL